jgi:hypothetical protein
MTHNLEWRDVRALFESLGKVEDENNGNVKVTVSGHAIVFQSPNDTDVSTPDQVSQIRHLLKNPERRTPEGADAHLLLVIDHQEARIFHTEMKDAIPERVEPYNPDGHKSHVHSAHDYREHIDQPNHDAYFQAIAKTLKDAEKILVFGSGVGSSSAMDLFVTWLGEHDKKLAERIIGSITVDQGHLTEGQLLAKAREMYAQ